MFLLNYSNIFIRFIRKRKFSGAPATILCNNIAFFGKIQNGLPEKQIAAMPERHFILPERACREGISKGNLVPLGPPVGVRDPLRRGPGFLLLFSIKSKGESPCFAVKVLNGRTANVGEPFYFGATAPNPCEALLTLGSEKE